MRASFLHDLLTPLPVEASSVPGLALPPQPMAHLVPITGQASLACLSALQTHVQKCSGFSRAFVGPSGEEGFPTAIASLIGAHLGSERPSPLSVEVGEMGAPSPLSGWSAQSLSSHPAQRLQKKPGKLRQSFAGSAVPQCWRPPESHTGFSPPE